MDDRRKRTLVFDYGAGNSRIGYEPVPSTVFPSIVGMTRFNLGGKSIFVGSEAIAKRGIMNLKNVIECGKILDWFRMEAVWNHSYETLGAAKEDSPVVHTYSPLLQSDDREELVQIFFETLGVPSLYLNNSALFAMKAAGHSNGSATSTAASGTTGVLVDLGKDCTTVIVILDGEPLSHTLRSSTVAGNFLTEYFTQILAEREFALVTFGERMQANGMKEKLCYVPLDYEAEVVKWNQTDLNLLQKPWEPKDGYEGYEMPNIEREQYLVGEAMFKPMMGGSSDPGITQLIWSAIAAADKDLHPVLFNNIVLSGGTSLMSGLSARLKKELEALALPDTQVRIVEPENRQWLSWIGAAQFASSPDFDKYSITKQQYDEFGPAVEFKS